MKRERIVVAMSGGVDSAVAAARLHDAGHEVVGVTLHLWDYPDELDAPGGHGRCCAPEDQYDARRTADALGFPHYTFDRRDLFAKEVVAPFVDAYVAGETPSPCTTCNREVKLAELFAIADRLGARGVATGHYARTGRDADGTPFLLAGRDDKKDQSYFLYATPREKLERLVFPLGESTKAEVRAEALARGLPGASKGESQELCFVGGGEHAYTRFVEERSADRVRPGPIVDDTGRVVGEHAGVHRFTVGQRKGLGVALGRPIWVTQIDAATNTVHLGGEKALAGVGAKLDDVVLAPGVSLPLSARVRIRYRHPGAEATIVMSSEEPGSAHVTFREPVAALTPGQIAVFYDGDRVLGGGRLRSRDLAS
ncbi:tRNA 2-thiouridine(34) synthase MnmA [Pendulispora rubella]|uniref:tRNA-specific 2-thiouridylase MnmA n=1 Tax=Pendulispora rubella TaxID=2741070 RepID=A0ABZ2LB98_9BACT